MRLWLLSLVAGITLGVAGTPIGKVFTGREQGEKEKKGQVSLEPNNGVNSLHLPETEMRNLTEFFEHIEKRTLNESQVFTISVNCKGGCNESKMYHLNNSEKEKEAKGQREPDPYKETLNLPRAILLQLLNQTKALNQSSEMDFIHWNLNGSISRDLCEGCCKEKEKKKRNVGRQSVETLKSPRKKRPGQWTILGSPAVPVRNSSINMVMMMFHNGTFIGYQAKKVTQQAENLREGWCSGCCKDDETMEALERREGEVREVPPAWT
ncbi:uncharacterized protein LOC118850387 isoform X2 [Trichosurus vulpecula]|uniref:uncharacterized protein LOC118850387 isoform X2 n=1 Tax=Trichosurus vulpecula TaxID=9337 RepID=UPI00186AE87D|nr:uncharacterized protein LOC118850387 isoform X2 [Trichosurus vulpecula]